MELIELFSINQVSLVEVSSCSNTGSIKRWLLLDLQGKQFRIDKAIQYEQSCLSQYGLISLCPHTFSPGPPLNPISPRSPASP